jgi:hypothetical protein
MLIRIGAVIGATLVAAPLHVGAQVAPFQSPRLAVDEQVSYRNAVGDVNEDGHLDILTTAGGPTLMAGAGDGTFTSSPLAGVSWGTDPTLADMNDDGHLDLGFTLGLANKIQFYLGDGAGAFVAAAPGSTSFDASDMAIADFNGDGILDAVVACDQDFRASLLIGNGDGSFKGPVDYGPLGDRPAFAGAGDLDNDGFPEFAIANFYSDTISLFVNDGAGDFGSPTQYGTGLDGFGIEAPRFADFDEDGFNDVVVATSIGPYLFDGNGDGTLGVAVALPTFAGGVDEAIPVDLDEDGHLDILQRAGGSAQLILGNGDGTFGAPTLAGSGVGTLDIDLGDFNEDGDVDMLAGHHSSDDLVLVFGEGDGTFRGLHATQNSPEDVAMVDLDGDGNLDLLTAARVYLDGELTAFLGDGEGGFGQFITSPGLRDVMDMDVGDLDGDGVVDVALVRESFLSPRTVWAKGSGDGTFGALVDLVMGADLDAVRLADMNGDGDLDVVVASTGSNSVVIRAGHGDGTFDAAVTIPTWFSPVDVVVDDVDGDGNGDLTTFHNGSGTSIEVRLGNGDLTFAAPIQTDLGGAPQGGRLLLADLNDDGDLDLIATGLLAGDVGVMLGNGDGTFGAVTGYATSGLDPRRAAVGDVDRDGDVDVVVSYEWRFFDRGTISVHLNDGTGALPGTVEIDTAMNLMGVALGDVDKDGALDAVVAAGGSAHLELLPGTYGPWTGLGQGLAGTAGIPRQRALGMNASGAPYEFRVDDALPFGDAWWVLGLADLSAGFKGGTLVPTPDVIVGPLPLDADGSFAFGGSGPVLPPGLELWYQWWVPDTGAVKNFAATNGVRGLTW